ncbi:MAG TPA: bacterial transcriptional activator domain-containing protein, partial [Phycisphaeraceae bacterium]
RLVGEHLPASAWLGIGPAGFSSGYLHAKNPLSPEEVTSAHNVFVDFITTLGVGGWAWSILLLLWLWQAGRSVAGVSTAQAVADEPVQPGPDSAEDEAQVRRQCLLLAAILGGVIFGTQRVVESQKMWIDTAILWLIGLVGFIGVSVGLVIWRGASRRDARWLGAGLWVGAAAVLTHSQIEMAFYQPASSGLVWAMMALAAGPFCPAGDTRADAARPRWRIYLPAGAIACAGLVLLVLNVKPLTAHQQSLARAAQAIQEGFPIRALEELDRAGAVMPSDLRAMRWRVLLRLEWAAAAMQQRDPSTARRRIEEALAILEQARSSPSAPPAADRLYASVQEQAAQWLHEPDRLSLAVEAIQRAIRRSPYSLADHLRLGDGLWELGRRDEAAAAYRRALELSEQNYLDPARQLNEVDRQRILDRLNAASTPQ